MHLHANAGGVRAVAFQPRMAANWSPEEVTASFTSGRPKATPSAVPRGHEGPVTSLASATTAVALLPAACSQARVWDAVNGQELLKLDACADSAWRRRLRHRWPSCPSSIRAMSGACDIDPAPRGMASQPAQPRMRACGERWGPARRRLAAKVDAWKWAGGIRGRFPQPARKPSSGERAAAGPLPVGNRPCCDTRPGSDAGPANSPRLSNRILLSCQ